MVYAFGLLLVLSVHSVLSMQQHPIYLQTHTTAELWKPWHEPLTDTQVRAVHKYSFDHLGHKPLPLTPTHTPMEYTLYNTCLSNSEQSVLFERVVAKIKLSLDQCSDKQLGYTTNAAISKLDKNELSKLPHVILDHCNRRAAKIINPDLVDRLVLHFTKLIKEKIDLFNIKINQDIDLFNHAVVSGQINVVQALIKVNEKLREDKTNKKTFSHREIRIMLKQNTALHNYFHYNKIVHPQCENIILQPTDN
ncbi:hypothetical protein Noda2021_09480 [Candidatus Dependentiae bacterium Noda2021]|nr:hypothetical protein Noda2021_09480 [Candidatus Dependentiae bacterium Noda2021]